MIAKYWKKIGLFNISLAVSTLFSNVGNCMFALSANDCTASIKLIPSIFIKKVYTLPPTPQPKQ